MNLLKRQKTLIAEMVKQRGTATISEYAQLLRVSERTISNDLKSIENYLDLIGYSIIRLPGIGIRVDKNNDSNDSLTERGHFLGSVQDQRIRYIVDRLLFKEEVVTYESLSEELMVSKTSIKNDIETFKRDYLNNSTMSLISGNQGTYLVGDEDQIQRTYSKFNEVQIKKASAMTLNETFKLELLSQIYGESIVKVCNDTLYKLAFENISIIDDFYLFNVLNVLVVLSYRVNAGFNHANKISEEKTSTGYQFANRCLEIIGNQLNLTFTEGDLSYLSDHMEANKLVLNNTKDFNDDVSMLINNVSDLLDLDLRLDKDLLDQLEKHFTPMIFRLRNNIINHNPFADQFIKEYSMLFNILTLAIHETEENLNVIFNSDEIGYLLIYFQLAIERKKISRKVLIVCPLGISASHLLMNSIQNILPAMDVVKVASMKQLEYTDTSDIDFVVSTIRLEIENMPVIVVSPILTKEDKQNILNFYSQEILGNDETESIEMVSLGKYISETRIHTNVDVNNRSELFELFKNQYSGLLFEKGFVESVVEREEIAGTDNPTGTAVPHGKPIYVLETGITIYRLNKKIEWDTYFVDSVIFVHIKASEIHKAKEILSNVYKIIKDDASVKFYLAGKTPHQIATLLDGGKYDQE